MKKFLIPLLLFFFCISHPASAVSGAAAGLSLWYCTVLPTLLPCMILSGYLISSSLVKRLPPLPFAFLTGWFCGYPMGAKTIGDLWKNGRISKEEGDRLLTLCCMPSPMYLTGYLCSGMLRIPSVKVLPCLICVYLPPLLCFALEKLHSGRTETPVTASEPEASEGTGFLSAFLSFEAAMMNGFLVIVKVGGYLMFFTMLAYFFVELIKQPLLSSLIPGILEMTSGTAFTVSAGLPKHLTVALCFAYAAFGGLSGFAQTVSVLSGTPFSKKAYLFKKLLQGTLTFLLLFLLYPIL